MILDTLTISGLIAVVLMIVITLGLINCCRNR